MTAPQKNYSGKNGNNGSRGHSQDSQDMYDQILEQRDEIGDLNNLDMSKPQNLLKFYERRGTHKAVAKPSPTLESNGMTDS